MKRDRSPTDSIRVFLFNLVDFVRYQFIAILIWMCLFYKKRLGGKSGTKCSSLRSNITYQISLDTYGFCLKVIKNDVPHLRKKMEREIDEGECQDQSMLIVLK